MRKLWTALGFALVALLCLWIWQAGQTTAMGPAAPSQIAEVAAANRADAELRPATENPAEPRISEPDASPARAPVIVEQVPPPQPASARQLNGTVSVLIVAKETLAPIEGVRIQLYLEPDRNLEPPNEAWFVNAPSADTDSQGRADLEAPPGSRLRLSANHLRSQCARTTMQLEPLAPGEKRQLDIPLATQADLRFIAHVVSAEDRSAIEGASVAIGKAFDFMLRHEGRLESRTVRNSVSTEPVPGIEPDDDGYFEINVCSWKVDAARFSAPGCSWVIVQLGPGHEQRESAYEVLLSRAAALEVQVFDFACRPIAGSRVRLKALNDREVFQSEDSGTRLSTSDLLWEAIAERDGRARIEGLPPHVQLSLGVVAPGRPVQREPVLIRLEPGEARKIEVVIGSGATIAGSLTNPDGSPKSGSEIWLQPVTTEWTWMSHLGERQGATIVLTDEGGRFAFTGVLDGQWNVSVNPNGPLAPVSEEVGVREGVADREVHLLAWSDVYIRGKVLDPEGQGFVGANVSGINPDTGISVSAETGEEGRFVLGPLAQGTYFVSASPWHGASALIQSELQQVQAGTSDAVIRLKSGGRIRIRCTGPDGASASHVVLQPQPGTHGSSTEQSRIGPGREEDIVFDVEPGSYSVSAYSGDLCGVLLGIQVAAGEEVGPFDLTLRPAGRVRMQYDGTAQWATIEAIQGNACVQQAFLEPGGSTLWVVPPGELEMICTEWIGDGSQPRSTHHLVIAVGETAEVRFGTEQGGK